VSECYDFPEIVIHDSALTCGRYKDGGFCVPKRMPDPPETDEQRRVLKAYHDFVKAMRGLPHTGRYRRGPRVRGKTVFPDGGFE